MQVLLVLALIILTGCVPARDPQLVGMKQPGDSGLSCEQIAMEYRTNTEVAQNKIAKNHSDDNRELLLGILVWPGLFDLKNADGNEGNALLDRNLYLRELAASKSCPSLESWPSQPARYATISFRTA